MAFDIVFTYITWIDLIVSVGISAYLIYEIIRRKLSYKLLTGVCIFSFCIILASLFNLNAIKNMIWLSGILLLTFLNLNQKEKEHLLHHKKVNKTTTTTIESEDKLFSILEKTVTDLSNSKTGALITIERNDNLTRFLSTSGVNVDAPISAELLETIFVNKTPLHDGAVIIRGNYIVAAAVFYPPTQKALIGKYGSRHRAAIGVSELCDAITIVVSEETGHVSFAVGGELTTIPVSDFAVKLKEFFIKKEL